MDVIGLEWWIFFRGVGGRALEALSLEQGLGLNAYTGFGMVVILIG